jgi:hypothetical protein
MFNTKVFVDDWKDGFCVLSLSVTVYVVLELATVGNPETNPLLKVNPVGKLGLIL